jgi:type IV pilus assembly protein PilV
VKRIVSSNKKGFTLIELLVAMLIMSIGLMALLDGITNYYRINMENQMRNEAMRIGEATLETLRNSQFSQVQTQTVVIPGTQTRGIRNLNITYTVTWTPISLSANSVAVQVAVVWVYKNVTHRHDAASVISMEI